MGPMETHPKIFEEEGHGSHVSGAVMHQRDESIDCNRFAHWKKSHKRNTEYDDPNCTKEADRVILFVQSKYPIAYCQRCFNEHIDNFIQKRIKAILTPEEFITFQVMHS
jgi:hypothetical protein